MIKELSKIGELKYKSKKVIELRILHDQNNYVKGFELQGCFSCFDFGLEECYEIINNINHVIFPVFILILGESIKFSNLLEFKEKAKNLYNEKYCFFKKGHPRFNYSILPSKYYKKYNIYRIRNKFLKYKNKDI